MKNNKRGFSPFWIVLAVLLVLIVVYLVLLLPIPSFTAIRSIVNYFLVLILWLAIQIGIVTGFYEIGKFFVKNFTKINAKIINLSNKFRKFVIFHS